jgi:hypothetical protein
MACEVHALSISGANTTSVIADPAGGRSGTSGAFKQKYLNSATTWLEHSRIRCSYCGEETSPFLPRGSAIPS